MFSLKPTIPKHLHWTNQIQLEMKDLLHPASLAFYLECIAIRISFFISFILYQAQQEAGVILSRPWRLLIS